MDTSGNLNSITSAFKTLELEFEGNFVRNLQFNNSGKLWIGKYDGVFIYNPVDNIMEKLELLFDAN